MLMVYNTQRFKSSPIYVHGGVLDEAALSLSLSLSLSLIYSLKNTEKGQGPSTPWALYVHVPALNP